LVKIGKIERFEELFELISSQKIAGIVKKIAGVTKIDLYQMNASS